jgi:TonB family protein
MSWDVSRPRETQSASELSRCRLTLRKDAKVGSRVEIPDDAADAVLAIEKNHADRIVPGNKSDAPLTPVSRSKPLFLVTVRSTVTTGKAVSECLVDQKGHARLPRVVSATDPAFGYAAVQAANAWWFAPPKQDGRPVVTRVRIPFAFSRQPDHPAATKPGADRL